MKHMKQNIIQQFTMLEIELEVALRLLGIVEPLNIHKHAGELKEALLDQQQYHYGEMENQQMRYNSITKILIKMENYSVVSPVSS